MGEKIASKLKEELDPDWSAVIAYDGQPRYYPTDLMVPFEEMTLEKPAALDGSPSSDQTGLWEKRSLSYAQKDGADNNLLQIKIKLHCMKGRIISYTKHLLQKEIAHRIY